MKRITRCLLASMILVLMFGMTSQAAVKKVTITAPTKAKTYTVYRTNKNVSKKIKANVTVTGKKDSKKVTYKSSNPAVVSVTGSGKIICKKAGTATITVASRQTPAKKATLKIKVVQRATKLTAQTEGYTIKKNLTVTKGKSIKVTITASPEKASNKVTWKSSNNKIAKVDKKGKISAKKTGTATITATAKDGSKKKVSFKVKVVTGKVKSIAVDKSEVALVVGGTKAEAETSVKATVKTSGKNASKYLGWETSNKKVATVKNGNIQAVAPGTATITVKATDGSGKKAVVKVTVTKKAVPQPNPAPEPKPEPKPTVYSKELTANTEAFTNGFTVKAATSVKWSNPDKALQALNDATRAIEKHMSKKSAVLTINGEAYTITYTASGWKLFKKGGEEVDLAKKLLSATAGDIRISNKMTKAQAEAALERVYAGKALLTGPYDFGQGTVSVNGKVFNITKFIVKNGTVEAVIDGANITVIMSSKTTITVTSDKQLDGLLEAVEAIFGGAYTAK